MMDDLDDKEIAVLDFITKKQPTFREIISAFPKIEPLITGRILQKLRRKRYITYNDGIWTPL